VPDKSCAKLLQSVTKAVVRVSFRALPTETNIYKKPFLNGYDRNYPMRVQTMSRIAYVRKSFKARVFVKGKQLRSQVAFVIYQEFC
jgi:hypothetical protein